jgi:hypothetical protein
VAPSSSANKVAKLASKGKGKKVRFQGGTVFPAIVLLTVVLLTALVIYARESRPADGSGPPQVGDHWHAAFGIKVCDVQLPKLVGNKEDVEAYNLLGVHSHDDGVIHYHPFSSKSSGNRANLGVFLDLYGVELSGDSIELPPDQGGERFSINDDQHLEVEQNGEPVDIASSPYAACADKEMQLKVRVWDSFDNPDEYQDYITDLDSIPIRKDGMVFQVALVEENSDIPQPEWASELPDLGAADGGNVPTTTIAGSDTTVAGTATTVTGTSEVGADTTVPATGSTVAPTDTAATGSTVAPSDTPAASTGG